VDCGQHYGIGCELQWNKKEKEKAHLHNRLGAFSLSLSYTHKHTHFLTTARKMEVRVSEQREGLLLS
jgi:hypothetical protein